ncbi:MAG: hypothetical protein HRU70_04085 [Phycisphaeraceae bacterium]|nr:MAG: hypothetical protein HRU70_04085 [Phycisphaeraceae bacterium]
MHRRVVITGLGAVSPMGVGFEALWGGLLQGRSALGPITRFDATGFPCRVGGEVAGYSAKDHVPKHYRKAVKVMARDIELAVGAAKFAAEDAGLITRERGEGVETTYPADRTGCHIGAGLIATETEELSAALATSRGEDGRWSAARWGETGMGNLQPLWLLKYLPNMLACHVTIIHGAEGPSNTITCGDASGLLSIGESCRVIERGDADVSFAGGAESKMNLMGMIRTYLAGRTGSSPESLDGSKILRPYAPDSCGVASEAGGLVILEEEAAARARGAKVYAHVAGFGAGHSGWPPYDDGSGRGPAGVVNEGLVLAMARALRDAGVGSGEIDAVVPGALGTPAEDTLEAGALRRVFGERLRDIPLITLAPNIGQCWAGSGGLAVGVGARAILEGVLPARVHAGGCPNDLAAGACAPQPRRLRTVMVCGGSLGGQNAALVLRAAG